MPGSNFDLAGAFAHLHDRFDRMEDNVKEIRDMSIESQSKLESLVGNGQPGTVTRMEDRISILEKYKERMVGYIGAITAIGTTLGELAHFFLGKKH